MNNSVYKNLRRGKKKGAYLLCMLSDHNDPCTDPGDARENPIQLHDRQDVSSRAVNIELTYIFISFFSSARTRSDLVDDTIRERPLTVRSSSELSNLAMKETDIPNTCQER